MDPALSPRGRLAVLLLGFAFVALALVTRLPFQDRTLFISDAARYALALEHYDMTAGRPHPPGNPLYVGIVKVVDGLLHDPPTSLAVVSALASGIAFLFAYLLGRDLAGESAGWLAASLLVVSPLFWFFGGLAMPATGEAALSLIVAWLARRARAPDERGWFWGMTIALALAFGFRSTFAVLVAPLWLFAARRHPWRRIVAGMALCVLAAAGWTALVASLSGGFEAYRATSGAFLTDVVVGTKIAGEGLAKIPAQAFAIGASALLGLGLFVIPFAAGFVGCCTGRSPFPGAAPFLAAWALPAVVFHAIYDWAPRFGVLLMAPAAILAAAAAVPMARRIFEGRRPMDDRGTPGPLARAFVVLALAVNLALFLWPVHVGAMTLPEPFPSGTRILERNSDLARRDAWIRATWPEAGSTLILAYDLAFHAGWSLPEYRVVGLFPLFKDAADAWVPSFRNRTLSYEAGSTAVPVAEPLRLPDAVRRIVVYDRDYLPLWPRASLPPTEAVYDAAEGRSLWVAELPGPGCLDYAFRHLEFVPAGTGACPAQGPR